LAEQSVLLKASLENAESLAKDLQHSRSESSDRRAELEALNERALAATAAHQSEMAQQREFMIEGDARREELEETLAQESTAREEARVAHEADRDQHLQRIAQMESASEELMLKIQRAHDKIQESEGLVAETQASNSSLSEELAETRRGKEELEAALEAQRQESQELTEALGEKSQQIEALGVELAAAKHAGRESEELRVSLATELLNTRAAAVEAEQAHELLLQQLQDQLGEATHRTAQLDAERSALAEQLGQAEEKLSAVRETLESTAAECTELSAHRDRLTAELETDRTAHQDAILALQKDLKSVQGSVQKSEELRGGLALELMDAKTDFATAEDNYENAQADLRLALEQAQSSARESAQTAEHMRSQIEDLRARSQQGSERHKKEIEELRQVLASFANLGGDLED